MSEADKNKRKALEKLEELVRVSLESCDGIITKCKLEIPKDSFSPEEYKEISYMIPKLKSDNPYLESFCLFRGISHK